MDDLYSFGKKKYVPADPLQRSPIKFVKNVLLVLYATVKCTVLGVFIIIKSILLFIIPRFDKDIQNQVALVRTVYSDSRINTKTIFFESKLIEFDLLINVLLCSGR